MSDHICTTFIKATDGVHRCAECNSTAIQAYRTLLRENAGLKAKAEEDEMLLDHERDHYYPLIIKLRAGLQEIYAARGEDELIAGIASPLIDAAK